MEKKILEKLNEIEKEYDVKILFAVESGSRAWGFSSNDSDYDVRFVYVHKLDYYLSLDEKRDVIEYMLDDVYDINGWDLDKTLKLLASSNPTLFEWLNSPIFYKKSKLYYKLNELSSSYFSKSTCIHHYLSMAKSTYKTYIFGKEKLKFKKYFYVIRTIMAARYILKYNKIPPVLFDNLVKEILPNKLVPIIEDLLLKKKNSNETELITPIKELNDYIDEEIEKIENEVKSVSKENISYDKLNEYFKDVVKNYDKY